MKGSFSRDLQAAARALSFAAEYDSLRLKTYRREERLEDRIQVSRLGAAVVLRFDDVGYFNRVYSASDEVLGRLPEVEAVFRGSPFGCELMGPPGACPDQAADRIGQRRGWARSNVYAWMHAGLCGCAAPPTTPPGFTICGVGPGQQEEFLLTYLRAFEAAPDRVPGALRNMRHLFSCTELEFLLAFRGSQTAGVGMLMRRGRAALLCAGAALPEFREMGCHAALLAARIQRASECGCEDLYSWTVFGGQSQANMERFGLRAVAVSPAWRLEPQQLP